MNPKEKNNPFTGDNIWLKYILTLFIGIIIIFSSNIFLHKTSEIGEYHYSELIAEVYRTNFVKLLFFIAGLGIGFFWRMNSLFAGLLLYGIFPLTSVIEGAVYTGSHNLLPFEFIGFFIIALQGILAVFIGKYLYNKFHKKI